MLSRIRTTLHTAFQVAVGFTAGLPIFHRANDLAGTAMGAGTVLGISVIVTQLMDLPQLRPYLSRVGLSTASTE